MTEDPQAENEVNFGDWQATRIGSNTWGPVVVRFGIFELDLRRRELTRSGVLITLHQQPYENLALLVRRRGELISRELIRQTLWPNGQFVDFPLKATKTFAQPSLGKSNATSWAREDHGY